jgi:metal-responsive CopG/Arc/MetJ family transcriptional regulator
MKRQYDFSNARRGPVVPRTPGKTRITIRLDNDIIEHFLATVDRAGGGNYQTLINDALREYIRGVRIERLVRDAIRREIKAASRFSSAAKVSRAV